MLDSSFKLGIPRFLQDLQFLSLYFIKYTTAMMILREREADMIVMTTIVMKKRGVYEAPRLNRTTEIIRFQIMYLQTWMNFITLQESLSSVF